MRIVGIDPGPTRSAFVEWRDGDSPNGVIVRHAILPNAEMRDWLLAFENLQIHGAVLAVEMVQSFGMAVGAEVFETVYWIGRFCECWPESHARIYRMWVKTHLCKSAKANDSNIRQAIIDRFGGKEAAIGNKRRPGPLYGIKGDEWSALAVALTYADQHGGKA